MSSHHIVREKQEPALLILELNNFDEEHLGQLLEWSPLVLVAQNDYEKIVSIGIKIDVVVCNNRNETHFQENIRLIYTQKSETTLQAALNFLIKQAYPAVNIVSKTFKVHNFETYIPFIDMVIFTKTQKHFPIKNGFSKWEVQNSIIQTFDEVRSFYGLQEIKKNTFSTLKDGFFGFSFDKKHLFIAQYI